MPGDHEAHRVSRAALALEVLERHLLVDAVTGEIHYHVEALSRRSEDAIVRHGSFEQPTVAADLNEGLASWRRRVERQVVEPGVRRVQDAEAVAGIRDLESGPRGSIHQDRVAKHPVDGRREGAGLFGEGGIYRGVVEGT